jgi:hypothetical protein
MIAFSNLHASVAPPERDALARLIHQISCALSLFWDPFRSLMEMAVGWPLYLSLSGASLSIPHISLDASE